MDRSGWADSATIDGVFSRTDDGDNGEARFHEATLLRGSASLVLSRSQFLQRRVAAVDRDTETAASR